MKYRIKQCGDDVFIPQWSWLGIFWDKFCKYHYPTGSYGTIKFSCIADAREFIQKDIERYQYNKSLDKVKYHKYP
jgi:hypothetical protein